MSVHLVSILGLPRQDASGDHRYVTATYRFPDGAEKTTTTFGLALADWFQTRAKAPLAFDRILWLGTSRSAWASLLQTVSGDGALDTPVFLELFEAAEATQPQLNRLAVALSEATGKHHQCGLVPPCKDADEQADFVALLTGELHEKDRVVLDLTHGLRNQSLMLAQSALMLEGAFGVRIEGLFYGGLEVPRREGEPAPAVDLTGLLIQARIALALAAFRQSGDVRVLAPHLPEGGFRKQIESLGQAVAIHDYVQASKNASSALTELQKAEVGVLKAVLERALRDLAGALAQSQYAQARRHILRRDWSEGITAMFEGAISELAEAHGLRADRFQGGRETAKNALYRCSSTFKALSILRNQVAHGVVDPTRMRFQMEWGETISRDELISIAKSPERFEVLLVKILDALPKIVADTRIPPST